jgi:hypothetical protein
MFRVEAHLGTHKKVVNLAAEDVRSPQWALDAFGAAARVYPRTREHLFTAIQTVSGEVPRSRVYTHTGWRKPRKGWVYLHAGGAIGPVSGAVSSAHPGEVAPAKPPSDQATAEPGTVGPVPHMRVELPSDLGRMVLPAPPSTARLRVVVGASLRLLDVAPDDVTIPAYATMIRAVLGAVDFTTQIAGPTGAGKTAVAALLQQHFGSEMDASHLPASWASTANANEFVAFHAKDALLVVDDFAPTGSQYDVDRLHAQAERFLRAAANRVGRGRLRPDATMRPTRGPRGMVLSTGEDVPRGQSLRARVFVIDMAKGQLDWTRLSACQRDADAGHYAEAMSGFIAWLVPRYSKVQRVVGKLDDRWRVAATTSGQHPRVATTTGKLAVAFACWGRYAQAVGAITKHERKALWQRGWSALQQVGRTQGSYQRASDPVERFFDLLRAAMVGGQAHVTTLTGRVPGNPGAWGWRQPPGGFPVPAGDRVGWLDGEDLYLEPHKTYQVVQKLAKDGGESISIGASALHKRLADRKLLVSTDKARDRLTVRKQIDGGRRPVLHLRARSLMHEKPAQPSHSAPIPVRQVASRRRPRRRVTRPQYVRRNTLSLMVGVRG